MWFADMDNTCLRASRHAPYTLQQCRCVMPRFSDGSIHPLEIYPHFYRRSADDDSMMRLGVSTSGKSVFSAIHLFHLPVLTIDHDDVLETNATILTKALLEPLALGVSTYLD